MTQSDPKVFISYSWSSPEHKERVRVWADRLLSDGIEVVLDRYDLKEGNDKFAFMEKMVTDKSVSHVLVFCDKHYAEKADSRKSGVGAESQIISSEIYNRVEQSKFIPIICELDSRGRPFLPTILRSTIYIDFSSLELVNENWERLIRLLFGMPSLQKPTRGEPPAYIKDNSRQQSISAEFKFPSLKQAILEQNPSVSMYRSDFLDACFDYADSLRVKDKPETESLGEKIVSDFGKLRHIRNLLVDWVLLEASSGKNGEFQDELVPFLERLRELKSVPVEVRQWNPELYAGHTVFVYETFLYIVAALLKAKSFQTLHEIFATPYLRPEVDRHSGVEFKSFDCFFGYSSKLSEFLTSNGQKYNSPEAELIKRHADRSDIPFESVIEAECLVLLMACLTPNAHWFPGTLLYSEFGRKTPFFLKATRHKDFKKLAVITGVEDAKELRDATAEKLNHFSNDFIRRFTWPINFTNILNLEKLDTL